MTKFRCDFRRFRFPTRAARILTVLAVASIGLAAVEQPAAANFKAAIEAYKAGAPTAARAILSAPKTPRDKAFLAHMLLRGIGGDADITRGETLLTEAAVAGYAKAQTTLASMLATGGIITKDIGAAQKWAEKAATQNQPDAMVLLSELLKDTEQYKAAADWLKKAASYGDAAALLSLGKADEAAGATEPTRLRRAYVNYSLAIAFGVQRYRRSNSEADALLVSQARARRAALDLALPEAEIELGLQEANATLKEIVIKLKAPSGK